MRIAICDNDKYFLKEMEHKLRQYPYVNQIEQYSNIDHFFTDLEKGAHCDLVFMDIDWDVGYTGIDYSEKIYRLVPHLPIIFITGFNDRFSQYILLKETNLLGYLTKPIQDDLLEKYLGKLLNQQAVEQKFSFLQQGRVVTVNARSIRYIESSNHVCLIHTENMTYKVYRKIRDLLPELPDSFIQCHKSYLVNMYWIQRMEQGQILLQSGEIVPVSRSFRSCTRERVLYFMGLQI
ncbi:MAG: LytR/AlgR family response regulator transcription factor [Oliverpabstia sp.]